MLAKLGGEDLLTAGLNASEEVIAGRFWPELILQTECPVSQYDALRQMVSSAVPPAGNLACVALAGQGFHGQHQRSWSVAPGNLHLSVVLKCDLPAAEFAPVMPALPAVAVTAAIAQLGAGQLAPGIKWVNDVLLNGKKVAGVLTALRTHRSRITAVVLGVGLNVEVAPALSGDSRSVPATSLRAELRDELPAESPSLQAVLAAVLSNLASGFERLQGSGPDDLLAAYRDASLVLGQQVSIWPDTEDALSPLHRGRVLSIEPDLSLRLQGVPGPIASGRLTLVGPGT
ncbi:MAG: biotin--[acetyl-CoA-carboxylase] ligase [Candidatus Krumholzibacteria bacterium]|nr:biotin--[acetyl-CoA-carboxylase] ligase [Candidatus Krumholzibacteria bacterium]